MTDLKCLRCGAAILVANQLCKFCTIEMDSVRPSLEVEPTFYPYEARPVIELTNSSIKPFDTVGDVLGPTFRLFTNNLWFITKLVVVIVAPLEILKAVSLGNLTSDWQFQTGTFLLDMLCNLIIAPALIFGLMKVMQTGEYPGVNQSFRWGVGKLGKLALCVLLTWLIVGLGYMLCVVPGVIFTVALALVYPLAVLEKRSPLDVLRDSRDLTKGHRWNIFLAGLAIYGLAAILAQGLNSLVSFLAQDYGALWTLPLAGTIIAILNQAPTILSLVMYLSIRQTLEREQPQ